MHLLPKPPSALHLACTPTLANDSADDRDLAPAVWVTRHALERLREHHPNVGVRGALALLARAQEVSSAFIGPFLDRSLEGVRDRYFVSADRRGVFVVVDGWPGAAFPATARTYLRFGSYQTTVAVQLLRAA